MLRRKCWRSPQWSSTHRSTFSFRVSKVSAWTESWTSGTCCNRQAAATNRNVRFIYIYPVCYFLFKKTLFDIMLTLLYVQSSEIHLFASLPRRIKIPSGPWRSMSHRRRTKNWMLNSALLKSIAAASLNWWRVCKGALKMTLTKQVHIDLMKALPLSLSYKGKTT